MQAEVKEQFTCMTAIGTGAKGSKLAFNLAAMASVATPLLDMSDRSLTFHHTYIKGQPIQTLTKPLTLRNISKLPLAFALK
jgi:hydrocephalus-inducing protein